jgi:hypothetical protein
MKSMKNVQNTSSIMERHLLKENTRSTIIMEDGLMTLKKVIFPNSHRLLATFHGNSREDIWWLSISKVLEELWQTLKFIVFSKKNSDQETWVMEEC